MPNGYIGSAGHIKGSQSLFDKWIKIGRQKENATTHYTDYMCMHSCIFNSKIMMNSYTYNQYNNLPTHTTHMRSLDPTKWDSCCISWASALWSFTLSIFFQVSLFFLGPIGAIITSWLRAQILIRIHRDSNACSSPLRCSQSL